MATTAMLWSAVASSVGLVNGRFQRHRTGALDRLQTSDINPEPVTPSTGVLAHSLGEHRHGVFILKAIVRVLVALK